MVAGLIPQSREVPCRVITAPQTVRSRALGRLESSMSGEQFSRLYLRPPDPVQDSTRARYRLAALLRERVFTKLHSQDTSTNARFSCGSDPRPLS
jgi:hypothetical protein